MVVSAVSTAAAAAIAVYLTMPGAGPLPSPQATEAAGESLVLAVAADVDIVSMDDRDAANLVVGMPPLPGKVVLAAADDVRLQNVQKDTDNMMPKVLMNETGLAPMIIAPRNIGMSAPTTMPTVATAPTTAPRWPWTSRPPV